MAVTCRCCRLPAPLRDLVAAQHRRNVPFRAIAEALTAAGEPVHRDAIWRHCRDHVAPLDLHDVEQTPTETTAGLTVAVALASLLAKWPDVAAKAAARVRAEGLTAAADVLLSNVPEMMRAALVSTAGTPASEVLEARVLLRAMRTVLGNGYADTSRALAAALRPLGGNELADALNDLADAVEAGSTPEERCHEVQVRALRAALAVKDKDDHRREFNAYSRMYGPPSPELLAEARGHP